jgi:hypothetical protein
MRPAFKIPPQVVRILLLAAAIVSSYTVARAFLTPASFGQFGFYRGDALAEATARPLTYAGRSACSDCHSDELAKLRTDSHRQLSCEVCHGPGQAHVENIDIDMQKLHYSHCIRCHEYNPSRPKNHKQIVAREHYTGSKCTECHVPHAPKEVP